MSNVHYNSISFENYTKSEKPGSKLQIRYLPVDQQINEVLRTLYNTKSKNIIEYYFVKRTISNVNQKETILLVDFIFCSKNIN